MSYLIDSDWLIDALAGRRRAIAPLELLASQSIAISVITLAEVYQKAFETSNPEAQLATFRGFLAPFRVIQVTEPIAVRFAEIRAFLSRRGQIIPDLDILIGATALHHDLTLLTFNLRHFSRILDLKVYQPG